MPTATLASSKKHARQVVALLKREYADATCALVHDTPFELLIATILSAQCTDERVNIVTKDLFAKYSTPAALAAVPIKQREAIQSWGSFATRRRTSRLLRDAGQQAWRGVPAVLEQLVRLPGVGRKTAMSLGGFRIASGVVVDTHVTRLTQRLGLTEHEDAVKIERDLIELVPQDEWIDFSHRLIWHGRRVCQARRPLCGSCVLEKICPKVGVE
jgi:endonuclease-3